jgi:hypothetical protein
MDLRPPFTGFNQTAPSHFFLTSMALFYSAALGASPLIWLNESSKKPEHSGKK